MRYFKGHASKWTRWCIWDIFKEMGFEMHKHDWRYELKADVEPFDVVFGVQHLHNVKKAIGPETLKMIRTTTMEADAHNRASKARVDEVNSRRNAKLEYRRLLEPGKYIIDDIRQADYVVANGNNVIKSAFPAEVQERMHMIDVTRAYLDEDPEYRTVVPKEREWLWHFGSGAIHKGLDLCLEAFARHPEWTLNVTGNLSDEPDFMAEFEKELHLPNISYHGWVQVNSSRFKWIVDRCVGFIGASCSEGQSPAVATCLTFGLYPVISKWTGITLPDFCGIYLDELTIEDVEEKVGKVMNMSDDVILEEVQRIQVDAAYRYSQERFREVMKGHIERALKMSQDKKGLL